MTEQIDLRARIVVEDINGCECTGECLGESPANCAQRTAIVADALRAERNRALDDAAAKAGTMAERPYDNEPEFSAVLAVEAAILAMKGATS